jgi:hypothetical protein
MTAHRVDTNQAGIVAALRAAGCTVECLHAVGGGVPDLLVGTPDGRNLLLEVKSAAGRLTVHQRIWHRNWQGQVAVVRDVEEAMAAVGA